MSFPAAIPAVILDTVVGRLACLFLTGAGGDPAAAHHAASQMLIAYDPQTQDELRLAAEIISFGFHALEALGQAASPGLSINHLLRLRGGAVSLSRASHKAQRRLDQLQKARRTGAAPQASAEDPPPPEPKAEKAIQLVETTRDTMVGAKASGQTWTQAFKQRQRAKRIAMNLSKNNRPQADGSLQPGAPALTIPPTALSPVI